MFLDVPVIEMLIVDCLLHRYRGRVKNRMIIFICKDLTASERLTLSIILSLQFSSKEKIKNDPIPGTPKRHGEPSFQGASRVSEGILGRIRPSIPNHPTLRLNPHHGTREATLYSNYFVF